MTLERRGYVVVPRDRQGMVQQMAGEDGASDDSLLYVPFSRDEARALLPLMQAFEREFGFDSEGVTVEQLIDTRHAATALELSNRFLRDSDAPAAQSAARKMVTALEAVLEYGSFAELAFEVLWA